MTWSLPLINPNTNHIDDDVFDAITMQQHKRFSMWSLQTGQSVIDLLRSARFMCRENGGNFGVVLEGTLPTAICMALYSLTVPRTHDFLLCRRTDVDSPWMH